MAEFFPSAEYLRLSGSFCKMNVENR